MAAFVLFHKTTNELAFLALEAHSELVVKESLTPLEQKRKELLERRASIAVQDRDFFNRALAVIFSIGIALTVRGFYIWESVIQPRQDKLIELQIQKTERELRQARKPSIR